MGFTEDLLDEQLGEKTQRSSGIPLDERLRMAFPGGVPREVREVFEWVPRSLGAASYVAEMFQSGTAANRQDNTERHVKELEARLDQLKSDHAALCAELERPQLNFSITPEALGVKMAARAGGERLIADFTAELERASAGVKKLSDDSINRYTLSNLALVIAGERTPDASLARDLGYATVADFVQGFFPQWKLEAIAKARAETEAKAEAEAKIRAEEYKETHDAWQSDIAAREQKDKATIAMVNSLDIAGVLRFLYGENASSLAIAGCVRGGPGSLPSASVFEREQSSLLMGKMQTSDPAQKRAYERLLEALEVAHRGEPSGWQALTAIGG